MAVAYKRKPKEFDKTNKKNEIKRKTSINVIIIQNISNNKKYFDNFPNDINCNGNNNYNNNNGKNINKINAHCHDL